MTQFQKKGFEVVKGFIPPFFSTYLRNYFTLRAQNDPSLGGDSQAPNSHVYMEILHLIWSWHVNTGYRKDSW